MNNFSLSLMILSIFLISIVTQNTDNVSVAASGAVR